MTKQDKALLKTGGIVAAVLFAVIIALNSWTTVPAGHVKAQTLFGKVSDQPPLAEGFHVVNPMASFDEFSIQDQAYELRQLSVPSQDKFASSVDITLMYRIDPAAVNTLRREGGTEEQALHKYVRQKLLSVVREFGKTVPKAQDLFKSEIQSRLQSAIQKEVATYAMQYGYTISDVFIQEITLDPVIKAQIVKTKQREEAVLQEQAKLDQIEKRAQQKVVQAQADEAAAKSTANALIEGARGKMESQKLEAEGLAAMGKAIRQNPSVLKKLELEVEMKKAETWDGAMPKMMMGSNADLLFDSRGIE
ncbi:SPFH domain-containing protein [Bacterioplanoides sp.]|uniref:SPFH domain-containing protein n=1 Tax=Bacterioplanoides sp. TaxID=2066072 RepID=UPI003B00725E